ncbi:GNAT family N-acetyltransferase [soil metagenome]
MDLQFIRTDSDHPAFKLLYPQLDMELKIRDGEDHAFYAQYNKPDNIQSVVIAFDGEIPVGCGALKIYDERIVEVKRMFVLKAYRGKRIATLILVELEEWAFQLRFEELILETGKAQPEAIALYLKAGYQITDNYGQYAGVEKSVCMRKAVTST